MLNGAFPIDKNGVLPLPQMPNKEIVDNYFNIKGIQRDDVQEILTEKFHDLIGAMTSGDAEKIKNMTEKAFGDKLISNLDKMTDIDFKRGTGLSSSFVKPINEAYE